MNNTETVAAELAICGGLMSSPAVREHLGALSASHFYDPVLARLYSEITRRMDAGQVADAVSLSDWLASDPGAAGVAGLQRALITHATTFSPYVAAYADTIRAAHARREAVRVTADALARLKSGDDVLAVLAESEAQLRDLGAGASIGASARAAAESFIAGMDTPTVATGIAAFDRRLGGLHRGELTIIAGRPSMGKTALAAQIARNVAEHGRAVHFASLEMPSTQLACRAMSAASFRRDSGMERVEYYHVRTGSNVNRELLRSLAVELPETLIIDDRAAQTLTQLEQGARATRRRLGRLDLILVDYLQLMRAARQDSRVQEVSEISQGLKAIAKRLECPVVALSQLSRAVEGRENKRPTLADLRDSGAIEQDADVVLACYREAYYLERAEPAPEANVEWAAWRKALDACRRDMEIITLKQRGGPTGVDRLIAWLEFDVIRDRAA